MLTTPLPSTLAGRVSSVTTWSWRSWSSAASSMVTMRSPSGIAPESTLSSGRLAGAGAAGDEDVQLAAHAGLEQLGHARR